MLVFYNSPEAAKASGVECEACNDIFFDTNTWLKNDKFTNRVLSEIDKATYVSDKAFKGRSDKFADLDKQFLSTGTKTLLNISQHPSICFCIDECGSNALGLLPLISDGKVYTSTYLTFFVEDMDCACNIEFNGKQYKRLFDFVNAYKEAYDESH